MRHLSGVRSKYLIPLLGVYTEYKKKVLNLKRYLHTIIINDLQLLSPYESLVLMHDIK